MNQGQLGVTAKINIFECFVSLFVLHFILNIAITCNKKTKTKKKDSFYYYELYGVTFLLITLSELKVLHGKYVLFLYNYLIICTVRYTAGYQQHRGAHCSTEEESCSFSPVIDGNSPGIRHCTSSALIATFSGCSHLLKCSSLLLSISLVPI